MIGIPGAAAHETLAAMAAALSRAVNTAVESETRILRDEAMRRCPADTGALRNSIRAQIHVSGDTVNATVGSSLPYAMAVEHGTRHMPPRPYLAPALDARRDQINARIRQAVLEALEGR